jgi:hypothetical protein
VQGSALVEFCPGAHIGGVTSALALNVKVEKIKVSRIEKVSPLFMRGI